MEEIVKALKSLVSDIEAMQIGNTNNFGDFSEFTEDGLGVLIEWPNLAISVDNAKKALATLDGQVIDGELAAQTTLCSVCWKPQFETPSGTTCENGHGGAEPMRLMLT